MDDVVPYEYPVNVNTFALPRNSKLRLEHKLYKPLPHTLKLKSEQGRTVFPELFIENPRLGTLADLCIAALINAYGPDPIPYVAQNPLYLDIHYDSISVEIPLSKCYRIMNEHFWKRVVLAKSRNKALAFVKDGINWKNLGVSLKYIEMVQDCPAEYWPAEQMNNLAIKIQDFVTSIEIHYLQSLQQSSFNKFFVKTPEETSSEEDEDDDDESSEDEEEEIISESSKSSDTEVMPEGEDEERTESQIALFQQRLEEKRLQRLKRRQIRETKRKERERRARRRARRRAKREKRLAQELFLAKKRKQKIRDFFDIIVSEEETDEDDKIIDTRNIDLYLSHKLKFDYPPEHCHHLEMSFLQYFINLETFSIEFMPNWLGSNYHNRYFNCSYKDIEVLSSSIANLPVLRVFRLRYSRMDKRKMEILVNVLKEMSSLEVVDLGFDNLKDDVGSCLGDLLRGKANIKELELESNFLNENAMEEFAPALREYTNTDLEYLGLARTTINDAALHTLVNSGILGTNHVHSINLCGMPFITEEGFKCCVANELLFNHKEVLHTLDISANDISAAAADELMIALNKNQKISVLKCRGSGLDEETDLDVETILKRNQYIAENPFVNNLDIDDADIDDWVNRTTNKIMLDIRDLRENRAICEQNRPSEFLVTSKMRLSETRQSNAVLMEESSMNLIGTEKSNEDMDHSFEGEIAPFEYRPDEFTKAQFLAHVAQPGPDERYRYFKAKKE